MKQKEQKYTYDEIFQRNIGIFTKEEQERIKNLKVAIAGVGGLGGPVAIFLARLGVGEIRIADADRFELSNINRQFGSYIKTIGRNKAEIIANEVKDISPICKVEYWDYFVTKKNVNRFLEGINVVVDAIDFYQIEDELALHREAKKRGLWVFTAQNAGTLFSVCSFDPEGITFEDTFIKKGKVDKRLLVNKFFPKLPVEATPENIERIVNGENLHISALSTAPPMGGSFVVEEIIGICVLNQKNRYSFPDLYMVDIRSLKIMHFKNGQEVL